MKTPYHSLPPFTRWSKAVAEPRCEDVDPVVDFPWKISASEKVATAGSCFAQHIARHLQNNGCSYYVVEDGHPIANDTQKKIYNYGIFSARYGNIYTTRQLVQLFQRAYGLFTPQEEAWTNAEGRLVDPFRPAIEPNGFATVHELIADREQHLTAVRRMFETLDVFVFTLGLTETWVSKLDGAVFPVCPGVSGGSFNTDKHEFCNYRAGEIVSDLNEFVALLRSVNERAKIILTVSPVPLIATAENRHVLVSTTYSKSALRVACDEVATSHPHVAYFPSYEIIMGTFNRGRYFAADLRSVTEDGVDHVMRLFLQHVVQKSEKTAIGNAKAPSGTTPFMDRMVRIVETTCEEELVEASLKRP